MYFDLSDEQAAIQEMSRSFASDRIAPFALDWDAEKHFPTDVLAEAGALGLGAIYTRDDVGGSGLGRLDAVLVFEALAQGCPTIAAYISIHNMCVWMIDRFGSDAQRREWCPRLAPLDRRASYCLTEPGAGSDAGSLATRAVRDGDDWVLTGQKQFISGAGSSDVYLVMARTGGEGARGISCFIVPGDAPGLSFGANERKMGWNAQPTRTVQLDGVRLGPDALLGAEGKGFNIAMAGLDGGRLNIAACSLGGAGAALDKARGYMAERRAFGQRLDQMQALQFRLADMKIGLEAARAFLWRAASALDAKSPDATMLCAGAKKFVTDTCFDIANDALQLHGGYGYLAEYGVEKIVRDLRVHQILEGTNDIMRLIVARSLIEGS
ncbi:acyl-CoA dehydrogenase family protein [Paracoccus sp. DMF-8]|uniref:acyl-CoA dehydrogenase family protein n=1 Tax=Paracoccus sp. DMF-8 TaxID=3019445 RepID=UPI0023E444FE|nr:acyl-CoA dehydrogenase family protein [Paracoccus sp. DMF-8]MDF3608051.1 acyl-CoA dehydrogenase family protein [Paracoccus sp. DMF-8]